VIWGFVWILLPSAVFALLAVLVLPDTRPPSRLRAWMRRGLRPLGRPFVRAWRWVRPEPPPPPPDPFAVLALQMRLGILADQMRALEEDPEVWARARRWLAVRAAYDALLEEACHLAGVELDEGRARTEPERFREEMELAARGWSW
jgi:hypothetical protein